MGTEPVHSLLLKMSAPLMLSMFVMAMYNVVDSIFVAKFSTDALAAVSYCFPFQNLNAAFGVGTSIGMSALLSRYLGAKDYDRADKVAHNGFILVGVNYTIFFIIGCFAPQIMTLMASDNTSEQIISDGIVYLRITQWLSFAPMIQSMFERLLQGTGKTKYIFFMQVAGSIFNVIMDPILIFGLLGFPRMGVKGAAIATVFGQLLGCVLGYTFNRKFNKEVGLSVRKIRPHLQTMKDIYRIGIPAIVLQSVGALMNFSINKILAGFSDLAVATFGVYFKLQSFVFMPIFGMNNGSVPIIAYNYGADKRDRLEQAMSLGVRYGVIVMSIGTIIFWLFPEQLMALFNAPAEMSAMGVVALHIMSLNFPFAGYAIMRGAAFQALGKSVYSMNISLIRQLVVIIPCAFIFAKIGGVNMVWWAFPIAEIAGTGMSIMYTRRIRKNIISKMSDVRDPADPD
ncbi:MAG: MATE family efflux transporter [Mogibacterium sp.]|nr:MATE family efflux transporter [Mogibacterium sp.]MBR2539811.1 MATE family efflux transporter [Mogibacterium sp.]